MQKVNSYGTSRLFVKDVGYNVFLIGLSGLIPVIPPEKQIHQRKNQRHSGCIEYLYMVYRLYRSSQTLRYLKRFFEKIHINTF